MNTRTKVLIAIIFTIICAILGNDTVQSYRLDRSIARDPVQVRAEIDSHDIVTRTKKGRETVSYLLYWHFDAAGQRISGSEKFSEERGAQAVAAGYLDMVHSQSRPELHKLTSSFNSHSDPVHLIRRLAVVVVIAAVVALIAGFILAWKFGWTRSQQAEQARETA